MFEKILLAVDGSEPSQRAVEVAAQEAIAHRAEVLVLHVCEQELTWAVEVEAPSEAAGLIDGVVADLKDRGVSARGDVLRAPLGQTPRVILNVARDESADLIVMGTRGLSDWGRLLMGSVAHKVVHLATCPVLVVR
ncbi:MAG TPA: universal stress protein [Actinomycetota bacterium]|jgi:nucleotide-binding universal stress UspA family protein|nr:universal stress protein [Actinomycetota bacterium]